MTDNLDRAFSWLPPWLALLTGVVGVAVVGVADYLTGAEISFSIFYLVPIALAAWYGGRVAGLATAGIACAAWLAADLLADHASAHPLIPLWNGLVRLGMFAIIAAALSEIRRRLASEERMARTDPLTGALNGRAFLERAEAELVRSRRYGRPFTLAYIDVDDFKQINDQHGHETGDRALVEIVDAVRSELRETDEVARLGGDELALLLIETGEPEARTVVGRVREAVSERMTRAAWPVTLSVGAVTFVRPPAGVTEMIRLADDLMYEVKRAGKDAARHRVHPDQLAGVPEDLRPTRPSGREAGFA